MKLINFAGLIIVFTGQLAQADTICKDYRDQMSLTVVEGHVTDPAATWDTSLILESPNGVSQLFGKLSSSEGTLAQRKIIEIFPFQGDTLTLVSKPPICGRGSCDENQDLVLTASLKMGTTITFFSCESLDDEKTP